MVVFLDFFASLPKFVFLTIRLVSVFSCAGTVRVKLK